MVLHKQSIKYKRVMMKINKLHAKSFLCNPQLMLAIHQTFMVVHNLPGNSPAPHGNSPDLHGNSPAPHGNSPDLHGDLPDLPGDSPASQMIHQTFMVVHQTTLAIHQPPMAIHQTSMVIHQTSPSNFPEQVPFCLDYGVFSHGESSP